MVKSDNYMFTKLYEAVISLSIDILTSINIPLYGSRYQWIQSVFIDVILF